MMPGSQFDDQDRCTFTVWAPLRRRVELQLVQGDRLVEMQRCTELIEGQSVSGYWQLTLPDVRPGDKFSVGHGYSSSM